MRNKKYLPMTAAVFLIMLFMFQSSVTYAAKPIKPEPTTEPTTEPPTQSSSIDITTLDSSFVINEDESLSFSIKASMKTNIDVSWGVEGDTANQVALLSETASKSGKRNITYYETANFEFSTVDITEATQYVFTISAYEGDVYQDQVIVTIIVNPVIITVPQTFSYVALGDSIPFGVSYEYLTVWDILFPSTMNPHIVSYSDQLNTYFKSIYATDHVYSFSDLSVSGYNAIDLLRDLDGTNPNSAYITNLVANADVISLCIGANDIMDAAPEGDLGRDFYNINWDVATAGRAAFEAQYPQIIEWIKFLNPDVKLMVMTIYNPYNVSDKGPGSEEIGYHSLVESYLSGTEGSLGLNTLIKQLDTTYGDSFDYNYVDVHDYFEKYFSDNKGAVTGFYDVTLPVVGTTIQDPHPDKNGQAIIYDLHYSVFNGIAIQ